MADAEFTFFVNPEFDFEQRRAIALAACSYIKERTQDGKGIGGKPFGNYSKNYIRHRDFETAGKEPGHVNLTLTGDMLDSIQPLDLFIAGRIVIGIQEGPEADKAKWMAEKGYDFLGLTENEQQAILENFKGPSESLNEILRLFRVS